MPINPKSLENLRPRAKGNQSRVTKEMRTTLIDVWNELQADPKTSLMARAKAKPVWFYELCKGMFPKELFVQTDVNLKSMTPEELKEGIVKLFAESPELFETLRISGAITED